MTTILQNISKGFNIIIIIICIWYYYMIIKRPRIPKIGYDNITFKTGDIILMHSYKNTNPMFICSYWGHIGIVYIDPLNIINEGKPVIFEACHTSKMKICLPEHKNGIIVTDLYTRLSKYSGIIAIKCLNKTIEKNIQINFIDLINYSKKNMKYNDKIFLSGIRKKLGCNINNDTNCGELIFLSLIKLGLIDISMYNKRLLHHLLYIVNITKLNDNFYYKPVEIIFNPF